MGGAASTFVWNGKIYVINDNFGGGTSLVPDADPPAPCILRYTPGADSFDEDYLVDLEELTGFEVLSGGVSRGDGTVLISAFTADVDPATLDPFDFLDGDYWERGLVDLEAMDADIYGGLEPRPLSAVGYALDGSYFVPRTITEDGTATLFRLSEDSAEEMLNIPGEIFGAERVN